jgi:hypothetical protein
MNEKTKMPFVFLILYSCSPTCDSPSLVVIVPSDRAPPPPVVVGPLRLVATHPLRRWSCTLSAPVAELILPPLTSPRTKGHSSGSTRSPSLELLHWSYLRGVCQQRPTTVRYSLPRSAPAPKAPGP